MSRPYKAYPNGMKMLGIRIVSICGPCYTRGVGRWFGKGGLYKSIGKGCVISVYKIESSYVIIRGHQALEPPWFLRLCTQRSIGECN